MEAEKAVLTVGIAVGEGTGTELAEVFKKTLQRLGALHGVSATLRATPRLYATYPSVGWNAATAQAAAESAASDAAAYEDFLLESARAGCRTVFRTAFNAQSIYLVRERLVGVKTEPLSFSGGEFFLVRDEAQGFYAGVNDVPEGSPDAITRTCRFSKATTWKILDFAIAAAADNWGGAGGIERIVMAYKFHILDNRFARWVGEYARARKVRIDLFQPDTMNRGLLRGEFRGKVLVIGANEWLDIMHADLLARCGGLIQEERFSRNVYLDARLSGLEEYQTVHGSADDIAGRGTVNPLATMRAAADILQRRAGRRGVTAGLETAIGAAKAASRTTPDLGGSSSTAEVMRAVLDAYRT